LIDGFPRNKENRDAWETTAGYDCDFVLFFDAPQDVMLQRLLGRDQGRSDDNETTIKLRFKTFEESSMPVVRYYEQKGKVNSVVATASPEAVYTATKGFFEKYK
jgi:UMP-CMP kinase